MSSDLLARFEGATTLCQCWQIETKDGAKTVCATDHDRPVYWQEHAYLPGLSLTSSVMRQSLSFAPEPLDLQGALNAEGLSETELRGGVWDGAKVTIWRVDWADSAFGFWLWSGFLTEIEGNGASFSVRLASTKSVLERTVGRIYGRQCDADLGDDRCGVHLESAPALRCDKRFSTCRDVFGNALNFRGFPHMPGNDAIISGPGDKRDGSSRGVER